MLQNFFLTLPFNCLDYNIIIIPYSIEPRTNQKPLPIKSRSYKNHLQNSRIDIEMYDEPTELTDIDNFDDIKNRDSELRSKDSGLNKNDVIRYLVGRSAPIKSRFKHDTDNEEDTHEEDTNHRGGEYDMPMSYDYESNYGENKIVGGQEVDINLYPYHVAYGTNCGGAIIDKKWVITAGHCGYVISRVLDLDWKKKQNETSVY